MFTVFVFVTKDGQIREPTVHRHGVPFTVADGTIYFCGSFWSSSEAEDARSVANDVLKTVVRHRVLSALADQTYMHHVVKVQRSTERSPTPKVYTRQMPCEFGSTLVIAASYMHELEARARLTHAGNSQLPRHNRDQFGDN